MSQFARTVCDPNCHADPKCGLKATIDDGKIIAVTAADYPVEHLKNRICMLGRSRLEYQYHTDRLRQPMKRVGERGADQWEPISWGEALELFVENHRVTAEKYGPEAVALTQVSGAFGLLTRGAMHRYASLTGATVSKAGGIDYGLPRGLEYMFGVPAGAYFLPGGNSISDAINSSLTILWGSNMAVTRSVDHAPLKAARRGGTRLICIDPTHSETAALCDDWISLRPGTDGALAWAMVHWIISQDLMDESFVMKHTDLPFLINTETGNVFRERDLIEGGSNSALVWCAQQNAPVLPNAEADVVLDYTGVVSLPSGIAPLSTAYCLLRDEAKQYTPEFASDITGVDKELIVELAESYAMAEAGAIRMGFGVDRWYHSDSAARIIAALGCLTGNIGIAGGGVSISGGSRFVPVSANVFYAPNKQYAKAMNMMELDGCVRRGDPHPVKMECIALANPFNQVKPNRNRVLSEYITQLDFICVIDHFMTETARQADLVLPAATIFERTDVVADSFVQLQQRVVEPEGEAKSDFEIFKLLAQQMGHGDQFNKTEEEYIKDILDASTHPAMADVTWERLKEEKVISPWGEVEPYVGFKKRVFPTQSGRVEFYKEELLAYGSALPIYREPIEASPKNPLFKRFPVVLLSAHSRYRIHSTFANMPLVQSKEPEPVMRISPADGQQRDLKDGSVIRVFNDRGELKIKCQFDDKIRPGTVLVSEGHWVSQFIEGDPYVLTHDAFNETAENYAHYDVLVEFEAA